MTDTFLDFCGDVCDPRVTGMVTYPLDEVFLSALTGVLCGADDWEAIALCASEKEAFLKTILPFAEGIPSEQTMRRVFRALDSDAFQAAFLQWVQSLQKIFSGVIAIDGKTLRGSRNKSGAGKALHLLSAFAHEAGLVIAQQAVDEKSNEIKAIPLLLEKLCVEGAIVTIDAMGTHREIAAAIIDKGGEYVLALKGNQGTLHEDVRLFFEEKSRDVAWSEHKTTEAGHGRIEERTGLASEEIDWLKERHNWPGLRSIVQITATRTNKATGEKSKENRLYISSLPADAENLMQAVRAHWSIENNLHWVMDVAFKDDLCRSRKDNAALNFAIIKHAALNILKQNPAKISINNKRRKAGWNHEFLKICLFPTKKSQS